MKKLFNKFNINNFLKYLVASTILAVPLYPKFPLIDVPGTYVSIRLEDFLIGLLSFIWLLTIRKNLNKLLRNKLTQSFLIFFFITGVSVLSGVFLTHTIPLPLGILHWGRRLEYMICFFIGISAIKKKEDLAYFIKCIMIVVIYAFFYGVGQKYFNLPVVTTQNSEYSKGLALQYISGGQLVSTFAGHYDLASFLLIVMPFLYLLVSLSSDNLKQFRAFGLKWFSRLAMLLTLIPGLWLLVNTASRISILSYFSGVGISLVLFKKYKLIPIFIIFSLIFIATSTNLLGRFDQVFSVYVEKYLHTSQIEIVHHAYAQGIPQKMAEPSPLVEPTPIPTPVFEDRSTSIRLNVEWPRAIRALTKNPLLGTGYSSITLATDNDYLRALGEVGILGFLAFGLIFFNIGKVFLKNMSKLKSQNLVSAYCIGIIGAIAAMLINATFIDVFEASKSSIMFWLLVGLAIGALNLKENEQN